MCLSKRKFIALGISLQLFRVCISAAGSIPDDPGKPLKEPRYASKEAIQLLKALKKIVGTIKFLNKGLRYEKQIEDDYLNNRPFRSLPPQTKTAKGLDEELQELIAALQNIEVRPRPANGTPVSDLFSNDPGVRRTAIQGATEYLYSICRIYDDLVRVQDRLPATVEQLEQLVPMLDDIRKVLEVLAAYSPPELLVKDLEKYFALNWYDYELHLIPKAKMARDEARQRLALLKAQLPVRKQEILTMFGNVKQALETERSFLTIEAQKLNEKIRVLEDRYKTLQPSKLAIDNLQDKLATLARNRDGINSQLTSLSSSLNSLKNELSNLQNRLAQLFAERYTPFEKSPFKCPNHASFNTCTHDSNKLQYTFWIQAKTERYNEMTKQISPLQREISRYQGTIDPLTRNLQRTIQELNASTNELRQKQPTFDTEMKGLLEQFKQIVKDREMERTRRFLNANADDQNQVMYIGQMLGLADYNR